MVRTKKKRENKRRKYMNKSKRRNLKYKIFRNTNHIKRRRTLKLTLNLEEKSVNQKEMD